jgi:hypothetical protein
MTTAVMSTVERASARFTLEEVRWPDRTLMIFCLT